MKDTLKAISILAIRSHESAFTIEQKRSEWLGGDPITKEAINLVEDRLGVNLPEDYKDFLLITNGFFTPTDATEPTFERIDKIDYLKNIDQDLIDVWYEVGLIEKSNEMARSIVIAGINDEQYFLLIPPETNSDKWEYWKFASWIPGEQSYEDLASYFTSVLDFLKSLN